MTLFVDTSVWSLALRRDAVPDRVDRIAAAGLRNLCRRCGVQLGTIDALLIQLCRRYELTLLSTDKDFAHARSVVRFPLWGAS